MKINPELVLVEALRNGGNFSETQLPALAEAFPTVKVGVKFGASLRVQSTFAEVETVIRERLAANPDVEYVREAFIVSSEYDRLRAERGIA